VWRFLETTAIGTDSLWLQKVNDKRRTNNFSDSVKSGKYELPLFAKIDLAVYEPCGRSKGAIAHQ
jgi:hypothetical protein